MMETDEEFKIRMGKRFEEMEKKCAEEQSIRCPYCKELQSDEVKYEDHTTYHGDEGSKKQDCEDCGKPALSSSKLTGENVKGALKQPFCGKPALSSSKLTGENVEVELK